MHRVAPPNNVKSACQRNYRLAKTHTNFINFWSIELLNSDSIQQSDSTWNNSLLVVNKDSDAKKRLN